MQSTSTLYTLYKYTVYKRKCTSITALTWWVAAMYNTSMQSTSTLYTSIQCTSTLYTVYRVQVHCIQVYSVQEKMYCWVT